MQFRVSRCGPVSSAGRAGDFLIPRSWVRFPHGPPLFSPNRVIDHALTLGYRQRQDSGFGTSYLGSNPGTPSHSTSSHKQIFNPIALADGIRTREVMRRSENMPVLPP